MKVVLGSLTDVIIIFDSYCSVLQNRLSIWKESLCVGLTGTETLHNYLRNYCLFSCIGLLY